jgi:hypothetical protein
MITAKDLLVLKFLSAGPDFYQEESYPVYHFIQLRKAELMFLSTARTKKEFLRFQEKDIHSKKAIGLHVIIQAMEAAFIKGFRTYGGKNLFSSVMISPAKITPQAANRFFTIKD